MKKIIFYQSHFCQMGGVETMAYNWCWWLRNCFDITVLYCSGDATRLNKMAKIVKMEKYDESKEYECDIFIRNSVWGKIPKNIKAKRMIEMRHANYKWLLDKGLLFQQYKDMGIKEIIGCGEYVSQMSHEALGDNPITIKNILMPKRQTNKVLHLISCTRIDAYKGWNRMLQLCQMMRNANIKFEWNIFTNSTSYKCNYEEVHFWKQRYDIWDYLEDADYCVLLSDSEGLPYTVQEALQYKVPCIVTDVGGCTELIKDGVNGYVVPLDMNFDVTKLLNIPVCKEYDNHALEDWLKYLEYKGKVDKEKLIQEFKEEKEMKVKVEVLIERFSYGKFDEIRDTLVRKNVNYNQEGYLYKGDTFVVEESEAKYLSGENANKTVAVKILEEIVEPKKEETKKEIKEVFKNIGKAINKDIEVVEVKPKKTRNK
jgi:hypothetical protein